MPFNFNLINMGRDKENHRYDSRLRNSTEPHPVVIIISCILLLCIFCVWGWLCYYLYDGTWVDLLWGIVGLLIGIIWSIGEFFRQKFAPEMTIGYLILYAILLALFASMAAYVGFKGLHVLHHDILHTRHFRTESRLLGAAYFGLAAIVLHYPICQLLHGIISNWARNSGYNKRY